MILQFIELYTGLYYERVEGICEQVVRYFFILRLKILLPN